MIRQSGSITLSTPPSCPRFIRTKSNIQKVKYRLRRKKRISVRKLSMELGISNRSVRRMMKNDIGVNSYKIVIEPLLFDDQKIKWKKFANWVWTNFRKKGAPGEFSFRMRSSLRLMVSITLKMIGCGQ